MIALLSLVASLASSSVYILDDGAAYTTYDDSAYSLCYGQKCQIGTIVEVVDSLATLDVSDCIDYADPAAITCQAFEVSPYVFFGHAVAPTDVDRPLIAPRSTALGK